MKFNIKRDFNALKRYILIKIDYFNKNIEKFETRTSCEFDKNMINLDEFTKYIINTYNVFSKLKYINLSNYNVNAKDLKIEYENFYSDDGIIGYYDPDNNVIRIQEIELNDSIYHELIHMASNYKKNDEIYCGFSQADSDYVSIGCGINEGYTELLSQRYFNDNRSNDYIYEYEINIARALELFIGKERMEKLYFDADLYGLINDLSFYASKNDIIIFIRNVDFVNRTDIIEPTKGEFVLIKKALTSINKFLFDIYCNKQNIDLNSNIINVEELENNIYNFTKLIGLSLVGENDVSYKMISRAEFINDLNNKLFDFKGKEMVINNINNKLFKEKQKRLFN